MSWKDERTTVRLNFPIEWGSEGEVRELKFKQPVAKDLMNLSAEMGMKDMIELAGSLVDHEGGTLIIKELHGKDFLKVSSVVNDFLLDSQEIGS